MPKNKQGTFEREDQSFFKSQNIGIYMYLA